MELFYWSLVFSVFFYGGLILLGVPVLLFGRIVKDFFFIVMFVFRLSNSRLTVENKNDN